jgi:hypothetical protein
MKTREKSIFAIGLVAALAIGFLIGISINFPKPNQSELAGTFGKAEKFRKVQMTQKDVQLRSELLKDTAQLKSLIQGLVYFSLCTEDVSTNIDLCLLAFKAQGLGAGSTGMDKISALEDYSGFISNNNKTLNATISMLMSLYTNDSASQSQDVEKNLKDFASYMNTLNQKNKVLTEAMSGFDNFMLTNKVLQSHKTEITQLKSIRDQLLIKGIQLGAALGNKEQVNGLFKVAFDSQEQLRLFDKSTESANAVNAHLQSASDLKYCASGAIIGFIAGTGSINQVIGRQVGGFAMDAAIFYSKTDLSYIVLSQDQINNSVNAINAVNAVNAVNAINAINASPMQMVATVGSQGLSYIILSNYSLQEVISAMPGRFDAALSAGLYSMGNLSSAYLSTPTLSAGFTALMAGDNLGFM